MAQWQIRSEGEVAIVSLDDGKANALLVPEFKGLEAALDEVKAGPAKACVLTGRTGFFSAGLNLKAMAGMSLDELKALISAMGSAVLKLFLFEKPVVSAVSGHALGAGAMFGFGADVRVFAEGSYKFGLNEVPAGLFVPTFAVELARSAVSSSRITELVVHGRVLSPMEALTMHVAESLHAPDSLIAAAVMRAKALATLSGPGYALTKRLVREQSAELSRARLSGELDELARMIRK